MALKFKALRGHNERCYFKEPTTTSTPFWARWWFNGESVNLDSIGRRQPHSNRRWLIVKCNCIHCDAAVAVYENALLIELGPGLRDAMKAVRRG